MLKNTSFKDIEKLSEEVHNSWMAEKFKQGFHSPDNCKTFNPNNMEHYYRDKFEKHCDKCHTDMYPYDELPDNIKEYDRVTVIAVLEALNKTKGYSF